MNEERWHPDLLPDPGIGPLADFLLGDAVAGYAPRPELGTRAQIEAALPEDDEVLWDSLALAWVLYTAPPA